MNKEKDIRYDAYYRKSSEAEDRQVQSIDDQRREMREFAARNDLNVIGEFEESQSAHHPGRPVFGEVMERHKKGISNGLLVWHANRTSRNPVDSGTMINLIDQGKLVHVKTPSHTYGNTPTDKMMLSLECMLAKKDSDDKSEAVKRGLRGRYIKGLPNGVAPIGFLNDMSVEKGNRGWLVDEEKFALVKQVLELFNSRKHSIRGLLRMANDEMGLRTPQHKKQGGRKLVFSCFKETILQNPVFAGFFITKDGERHELDERIPRAITEEQYWENQKLLGDKGRTRASKHKMAFAYTGLTKCGGCGGSVTAEHQHQVICDCKKKFAHLSKTHCPVCGVAVESIKKPVYLHYIRYHCTRTKDPKCKEPSVQELYIDDYLATYFKKNFKISKELYDWCIGNLPILGAKTVQDDSEKKESLESTLTKKRNEYKELVLMKAKNLIGEDDFIELKATQKIEITELEQALGKLGKTNDVEMKKAKRAFQLALGIDDIFRNGTPREKKDMLEEIQSNLTLTGKKPNVYNTGIYKRIIDVLLLAKEINPAFEPEKCEVNKGRNAVFSTVCTTLLRG